ncbi:MAG: RNA pyrophosphohydrolase [Gammaproteobacteria bacterium]
MAVIDEEGYRLNVGIILVGPRKRLFWGKRLERDAWQFPQGGMNYNETPEAAMYRELREEIGLQACDVELIACTYEWLRYRLPTRYMRRGVEPVVIGQKQKWFLLRLTASTRAIYLHRHTPPEFECWRWVNYWYPVNHVIYFKRKVYRQALRELENYYQKL